ncbi:uncharacterized protein cubi_03602 [Cryptosporidium ubiquitum]|uniref:Uncharacterized protein n=1 Tax=Cryptosporidium ubiquitum TaxID=857276 RepID=A0A1J4MLQ2_9CRYT|nr:uncharacterized protein cubi_03602 [Cryptosporidium ubiquitum]OII73805.1 hypothetical protein cubi_03602 [Cryptosporidium ubiquitum]
MERIVNAIINISDGICCFNNYILKNEEQHSNEVYQDVSDYHSYLTTKPNVINNDVFKRSLFTFTDNGNEYLEVSRNNKLFGSPVSLKSYFQKSKNDVKQHVFNHLEIAQCDSIAQTSCSFNEPINYYKISEIKKSIVIPKSRFVSHNSNAFANKDFNLSNSNSTPISSESNTLNTKLKTNRIEKECIEEKRTPKSKYLEVPTVNNLQIKSNPPLSKVNNNPIQRTPSMPTIKQYKVATKCPDPLNSDNKSVNNEENKVVLTKYGAYLLGL